MTHAADIQLRTTNRSENVAVVRELLDGVADGVSLPTPLRDEIKTAVSEACNNVVLHAYAGGEGPMELDATLHELNLEVVVRDQGGGIQPHVDFSAGTMQGVGLAVIQAFTDSVELRGTVGEGTEVRMEFLVPQVPGLPAARAPAAAAAGPGTRLPLGEAVVSLAPGPMLGPVLAHLAAALAVRARFSIDRLADAQLVADAIAAHAPVVSGGRVNVAFLTGLRTLEMRVGPLRRGAGEQLLQDAGAPGLGPVIVRLTNDVAIDPQRDGELLTVCMSDAR